MNKKVDIDAVLAGWPEPPRDDAAWEQRAEAIVQAAMRAPADEAAVTAALADPSLAREQGEPAAAAELGVKAGEKKMADENSGNGGSNPGTSAPPRKRQSLKEIAERASQSGMSRASVPPTSTPLPSRVSAPPTATPVPSAPSATSTPVPRASSSQPSALRTPLPGRPSEAGKDDSGIVDLATIREAATPQQKAAAEEAKPASEGLFDDDDHKAQPAAAAAKPAVAATAAPAKKKGSGGAVAGIAIAIVGLAAAFAIYRTSAKPAAPPPAPVAATETAKPAEPQP